MPATDVFDSLQTTTIPARNGVQLFARVRGGPPAEDLPLMAMIHGYPQSSHMWRYVAGLLPEKLPLFILDIPGYGDSIKAVPTSQTEAYSKREIGGDILDALGTHLASQGAKKPYPIILCGHDRGARITQRLVVDKEQHSDFKILGAAMLDIVPIVVQFQSFSNPSVAAATFHWPFLAAPYPLPEKMIAALGGPEYIEHMIGSWSGSAHATPKEGVTVYKKHFEKQSVIDASCADYRAAAMVDGKQQQEDQAAGRKIEVPTLVVYSQYYLGSRYDVPQVWTEWVKEGCSLTVKPIVDGVGHFMAEEAPEKTAGQLVEWLRGVLRVQA